MKKKDKKSKPVTRGTTNHLAKSTLRSKNSSTKKKVWERTLVIISLEIP
jgi:hypothetical protein